MSWRSESTFVKSSALNEEEKTFLKLAKKIREVWKLEEKRNAGETLDAKQNEKVDALPASIKELVTLVAKLPPGSEVLEKNSDMADLVPEKALKDGEKRRQQEQQRKEAKEAQDKRKAEEKRSCVEFQKRHDRSITDIAVSADGKFIYTSSKDKVVLCWSRAERLLKATCTYGGHEGAVWAVDVSAQTPAILASGSADGKVLFWPTEGRGSSTSSGVIQACGSLAHGGIVKALRWCPFDKNKFVTCADKLGSIPFHIAVWEAEANGRGAKNVIKMLELPAKANAVQWGDGAKKKIFSAHENGYVAVWGADDGKLLKTLKLHAQPVTGICLASDGITLLSASRDRTACVVDVSTPTAPTLRTYKTDRPLNAVAVTPTFNPKEDDEASKKNGAVLLGGGQDEMQVTQTKVVEGEFEALIYSNEGERWGSGKGHFGPVHAIRTVPGKQDMFATGAEDGCLYVHDLYGEMLHADNTR